MQSPAKIFASTILGAALWVPVAHWGVVSFIERAYRGESLPILNSIIERPVAHSLEHYLAIWREFELAGLVGILLGGSTLALLTHRRFQVRLTARLGVMGRAVDVDRSRRMLVYGIALTLSAGYGYDLISAREHWPFSDYSMYSQLRRETLSPKRLYLLTDSGERPLLAEIDFPPFNQSRMRRVFARLANDPDRERLQAVLEAALKYHRKFGMQGGAAARGIRLYEFEWPIQARARNRRTPRSKRVVVEAVLP